MLTKVFKKKKIMVVCWIIVIFSFGMVACEEAEEIEFDPPVEPQVIEISAGRSTGYQKEEGINLDYDLLMTNFPITNIQFVEFLNNIGANPDGTYREKKLFNMEVSKYNQPQIGHNGNEFFLKQWNDPQENELKTDNYPVVFVTWYGAAAYCNWLSEKEGLEPAYDVDSWELRDEPRYLEGYRLPTVAEWMYAAQGGNEGQETKYAGSNDLAEVGWYGSNSGEIGNSNFWQERGTMPVGQKSPNELYIYDLSGNVSEWTTENTDRESSSSLRTVIGGNWYMPDYFSEVSSASSRLLISSDKADYLFGFRVVRTKEVIFHYNLNLEVRGQGEIKPEPGEYEYEEDLFISVSASPETGWEFSHWEGEVVNRWAPTTTVKMESDREVNAVFIEKEPPPEMISVGAGVSSDYLDLDDIRVDFDFAVSRFPITNAQFVQFLNDSGVSPDGIYDEKKVIDFEEDSYNGGQIGHDGNRFYLKDWTGAEGEQIDIAEYPVVNVTWFGAVLYCNWLSEEKGFTPAYDLDRWQLTDSPRNLEGYRLPTVDEWRFAARGGAEGDETIYAGSSNLDDVGWYRNNSDTAGNSNFDIDGKGTMPVGQKKANELGIYDMSGNVFEWVNTGSNSRFVTLGGSWFHNAFYCEVSNRSSSSPDVGHNYLGFRPVRTEQ